MTILGWILLATAFVTVTCVWAKVNHPKNGVVSCCGCGKCAHTGECVMVRKKAANDKALS